MPSETETTNADAPDAKSGPLLWIAIYLGIMAFATVAGIFAASFTGASAPPESPTEAVVRQADPKARPADSNPSNYSYYDLEITCNLNDPRMGRYIRATIALGSSLQNEVTVREVLDKRKTEIKSWLFRYFADCTLDDVRGGKNLNRISREIQDYINERLWPEQEPFVVKVDFKDWAIQ